MFFCIFIRLNILLCMFLSNEHLNKWSCHLNPEQKVPDHDFPIKKSVFVLTCIIKILKTKLLNTANPIGQCNRYKSI